jgi:hypothetical protein
MNRKLKTYSLALTAAMTLVALLASTASAQFTSNKEHTIISGSQKTATNDVFTAGEGFGGITCENATYSGTAVNKSESTQVLSTSLETCKDTFGRTGDIHCTLCSLTQTSGAGKGTIHISGGTAATITSGGTVVCTMTFASPQTNTGVTYTNLGGTSGVEITRHTKNLISTTSGGFFNCGIGNGEHKSGTYDSITIVTGKDTSGAAAEISVD